MIVVFCLSYLNIPSTEILLEGKREYMVFTSDQHIYHYFRGIHGSQRLRYFEEIDLKLLSNPINWFVKKSSIRALYSGIKGAKVYFFCVSYCHTALWIIKNLSNNNEIFYQPSVKLEESIRIRRFNLKPYLKRLMVLILFNVYMSVHHSRTGSFLVTSKVFLSANHIQRLNVHTGNIIGKNQAQTGLLADVLYLTGDLINILPSGVNTAFLERNNALIKVLEGYRTIVKPHPRLSSLTKSEERLPSIDSKIPASSLLSQVKVVIGYSSAVLFEACNRGVSSISLLKFYDFVSEDNVVSSIDYLENNCLHNYHIDYPENLEELWKLIDEYVK